MSEEFNPKKFKDVLYYVIKKCADKPHVGKTVLFKMLYFIDFDFYELNERPLMGEKYRNIPLGPAPSHFDAAIESLKIEGKIKGMNYQIGDYMQLKFIPIEENELDSLNASEIEHIDNVIERLSHMNAGQIVGYTHKDMPVKSTKESEIINYDLVFYRDDVFSVREYDFDDD